MKGLHKIAWILLIIGGLNWGLEAFNWGVGSWGFIPSSIVMIIYVLVGLSAVYELISHKGRCKECMTPAGSMGTM